VALFTLPRVPELGPNLQRAHSRFAAWLGRFAMGLSGWRFEGELPDIRKLVLIVAPHTSNWDFVVGLAALLAVGLRGRFLGKCSPVHFFWGSFDLAVTRFSGRRAPERPDADAITREGYSHEVISHGFWPGGGAVPDAAFYAYAAPEPAVQFPPVTPPAAASASVDSTAAREPQTGAEDYFGYEIFTMSPKTFEPLTFGPVPANYLVGPGDEVIVSVWGAQEMNVRTEVNREGYLLIPDLGQVLVNGYTLGGLKEHLENRLSRIYSGIRSDGQSRTWLEVSLGKLRSIQVFVVGYAQRPGAYTVSSLSTLVNALFAAGGPSSAGSMRTIQLKRDGKVVTEMDLYDLLLAGDKTRDARLLPGDVIYIPKGSSITFGTPNWTRFVYVVFPVNWNGK